MNKFYLRHKKRYVVWLGILILVFVTAISVYAIKPTIGLNSPTSFPVDI